MKFSVSVPVDPASLAINRAGKGRRSPQYRDGIVDLAADFRRAARGARFEGRLECRIRFVFASASDFGGELLPLPDLDGPLKATFDALEKARVLKNDRQIRRLELDDAIDPRNPRIEVELWKTTKRYS